MLNGNLLTCISQTFTNLHWIVCLEVSFNFFFIFYFILLFFFFLLKVTGFFSNEFGKKIMRAELTSLRRLTNY